VTVSHRVDGIRNSRQFVPLDFEFLCEEVLIWEEVVQAEYSLTGDLLLLETNGYQADPAHVEVPDGLQLRR
jgi:hypothetical protein